MKQAGFFFSPLGGRDLAALGQGTGERLGFRSGFCPGQVRRGLKAEGERGGWISLSYLILFCKCKSAKPSLGGEARESAAKSPLPNKEGGEAGGTPGVLSHFHLPT